ncbi:hypothetical protein SAMN04515656_1467, partial [Eubacterium aggregans]
ATALAPEKGAVKYWKHLLWIIGNGAQLHWNTHLGIIDIVLMYIEVVLLPTAQ